MASDTTTTASAQGSSAIGTSATACVAPSVWAGPAPEHAEYFSPPVDWLKRHEAIKRDQGKPPMSLIPTCAQVAEAEVLGFGAKKYASHNWRQGFAWSRLLDAAMRHLTAFIDGEDNDPETGLSHIAHLRCETGFLLEHIKYGLGTDDRYKRPAP
jgi:hypothetical protein